MTPSLSYQINQFLRGSVPFWLSVFLVFMSVLPLKIQGFDIVTPSFLSIAVFYWSLHRPYLMPAIAVFFLGLLSDILTGAPMGLSSFILLIIHVIAVSQRQVFVGKAFLQLWWGYLLISSAMTLVTWILVCIYSQSLFPVVPIITQFLLTVLFFPLLAWFFALVQSGLMKHI
jgi:rod shape-determining protein MreD